MKNVIDRFNGKMISSFKIMIADPAHPELRIQLEKAGFACEYKPDISNSELLKLLISLPGPGGPQQDC